MGDVIDFKGREDRTEAENKEPEKVGLTFDDFFAEWGSYSNSELLPAYKVTFENVEGWDGRVTNIEQIPKKDSYMSLLSSGTCGLFSLDTTADKITNSVTAELDSDIEKVDEGKYELVLFFKEELASWVFEELAKGNLYFTAT